MSSDNTETSRLAAELERAGLDWNTEVPGYVQEWLTSRYDTPDATAFVKAGRLTPHDTDGAPRFRDWQPPAVARKVGRK